MSKYRAAIIGLGNIAWRYDKGGQRQGLSLTHASAYAALNNVDLVGGCSPDEAHRMDFERTFGITAFASLEEMFDKARPDIVSVCSPTACHYKHAHYCLEQSVPMIWLEKPPVDSIAKLDELIATRERMKNRSIVLVNYHRRYVPCYQHLRKLVRDGMLGECRSVQINYSRGLELNGSHMLDMLFHLLDQCGEYTLEWTSGDTENPCFSLRFPGEIKVSVLGHNVPYHNIDISVTFDTGRASVIHGAMTTVLEKMQENKLFPGFHRLVEANADLLGESGLGNCMEQALSDLIHSHEQKIEPKSNLASAKRTQALMGEVRTRQGRSPK